MPGGSENVVGQRRWTGAPMRTLSAGLVSSLVSISLTVALASVIFGPGLEATLPLGIGVMLMGSAAMAVVGALRSDIPGAIVGPQDGPATVLGAAAAAIVAGGGPDAGDTVLTMLMLSTAVLGIVLFLLGRFGVGRLLRFFPFPVMAGFLGGIGLVLLVSGTELLTDNLAWSALGSGDLLVQWLPALALATFMTIQLRTGRFGMQAVPAMLLTTVVGIHVIRLIGGPGLDAAASRGWFLGPFPDGRLWSPELYGAVGRADWGDLIGQIGTVATLLILVPVIMLLNTGAVEHEIGHDVDLDSELQLGGTANLLGAAVGSSAGYLHLSNTVLTSRMVGQQRGAGLVVAAASLAVIFIGGDALMLVPTAVVGGVLLAIGANFAIDSLWVRARQLPRSEGAIVGAIAGAIFVFGFLPGIALGLGLAGALFVVRYSRIRAVRIEMTGELRRSNVQRSPVESAVLDTHGDGILVLELDGFLFFGTAESILEPVRRRIESGDAPGSVILDFRRVSGIDTSASATLLRLLRLGSDHGFEVIISGLRPDIRGVRPEELHDGETSIEVVDDLDRALERCEERLLDAHADPGEHAGRRFEELFGDAAHVLRRHFVSQRCPTGTRLLVEGQPGPGLYFLEEGRASVHTGAGAQRVRHRRIRAGTVVGEIASYLGGPCTATVELETEGTVLFLSASDLEALATEDPPAAIALHRAVAIELAERLVHSNRVIGELLG